MRTLLAFILAPIPAATLQAIVVALWPKPERGGVFAHPSSMFVLLCIIFYVLQILIGIPVAATLRKRKRITLQSSILGGLAVTFPILLIVAWAFATQSLSAYAACYNIIYFMASGASIGAVFWLFRKPSRSTSI